MEWIQPQRGQGQKKNIFSLSLVTAFHLLWVKNGELVIDLMEKGWKCWGLRQLQWNHRHYRWRKIVAKIRRLFTFSSHPMWTTGVSGPYTWQAPASEGNHYFVCGVGVHCSVGNMKAAVEVSNNCWWPFCNCYNGSDWQINFHSIFIDKSLMNSVGHISSHNINGFKTQSGKHAYQPKKRRSLLYCSAGISKKRGVFHSIGFLGG